MPPWFCRCRGWQGLVPPLRNGLSLATRVRGRSPLARPRTPRFETPRTATQQRVPSRGPSVSARDRVTDTPSRSARRVPAVVGGMAAGTRLADFSPTRRVFGRGRKAERRTSRNSLCRSIANGRVAVKSAPRADAAIAPERAGPERPDRRVETLDPTERFVRGRGTARVRTSGSACSVAREGGSEGCARCAARATAQSPRGKRRPPRSGKDSNTAHPPGKKGFTQRKGRLLSGQAAAGPPRAQACQRLAYDDVAITGRDLENHRQRCATVVRQELAEEWFAQLAFARRGVAVAV